MSTSYFPNKAHPPQPGSSSRSCLDVWRRPRCRGVSAGGTRGGPAVGGHSQCCTGGLWWHTMHIPKGSHTCTILLWSKAPSPHQNKCICSTTVCKQDKNEWIYICYPITYNQGVIRRIPYLYIALQSDCNAILSYYVRFVVQGYVYRQALYACDTCTPEGLPPAGVCLACSLHCHEGHTLHELYTKRYVVASTSMFTCAFIIAGIFAVIVGTVNSAISSAQYARSVLLYTTQRLVTMYLWTAITELF